MNVLVTDGDSRAALAVTRSLGRAGHRVIVGERRGRSLAQSSRHCAGHVVYPDPAREADALVDALLDIVRRERIDVLLPVADITTLLVANHRARFEALCGLPLASATALERAADKAELLVTASRLGVPVPASVIVRTHDDTSTLEGLTYPVVLKPHRSRVRTPSGWLLCSVSYASSRAHLTTQLAARRPAEFPIILQERIVGPGLGVFACYDHGRPIARFSHRRLREKPPSGGVSVLCESVALDPRAREGADALLGDLGWHGVAMVEFKLDERDNTPKLMEINGRFWGSLQLAIDAGVDFPRILVDTLRGAAPAEPPAYPVGVRSRWLLGDLDALMIRLFGSDKTVDAAGRRRLAALVDFMKLWQPGLHYENPRFSDLGPARYEATQWLRQLWGGSHSVAPAPDQYDASKTTGHSS